MEWNFYHHQVPFNLNFIRKKISFRQLENDKKKHQEEVGEKKLKCKLFYEKSFYFFKTFISSTHHDDGILLVCRSALFSISNMFLSYNNRFDKYFTTVNDVLLIFEQQKKKKLRKKYIYLFFRDYSFLCSCLTVCVFF